LEIAGSGFLEPECPSGHPTNSVKTLKGIFLRILTLHVISTTSCH